MESAPSQCIEEIAAIIYDDNRLSDWRENIRYLKNNLPTDALINTLNQMTARGACA